LRASQTLYHLKVKDSNNLMVETNLFFDLKKHSWAYDSFVISQSDDEYIHNFKGLIIEPSNLSVDINVDVSSKISILKADQGVLGKEGLSVVELPDEPVTLLINKALDFKASDHAGIFFNQDSKVEIDRLSFERNTEFSLLYIAPVKKLSSLYIKDANFSTIYAKSPIKEMSLQDFNKDSKVVANLYIEADKSNKVINKVEAFNASFDRLSNADNIVKAKIGVNKELELINTTINGNEYDHTISGHIDTFSSKGATIFLDGNFKIDAKNVEILFEGWFTGTPAVRINNKDNEFVGEHLRIANQEMVLLGAKIITNNGFVATHDKFGKKTVLSGFAYQNDKNQSSSYFSGFTGKNSKMVFEGGSNPQDTTWTGMVQDTHLKNCIVAGEGSILSMNLNISCPDIFTNSRYKRELTNLTFDADGTFSLTSSDTSIVNISNSIFKGLNNKINVGKVDLVTTNSEFYKVNASFGTTYNLISEIKVDSCIFKRDVDITTSKKANISASSFYSSSLSKVNLIENSSFEDFRGDNAIYKNFNSVIGERAEPEINKDVGLATKEIELL
jgi:hypothetical protein